MEKFKAVEKEMKTKAYSKEGLAIAEKLDPKEREKHEVAHFLQNMLDDLERQIETLEAEVESLQVTIKKGKKDMGKSERILELERNTERHKWHQNKLELVLRSLENGSVDTDQVKDLKDDIQYYVQNNQEVDFIEDDAIYEGLNLLEEDLFGLNNEADRVSSQDNQSIADELPEVDIRPPGGKQKAPPVSEGSSSTTRRPSTQLKSPLPALASLHTSTANTNGSASAPMKPAPLPARAPGEPLKYASAAAAAAASDKNGVGIAPLPPPPGASSGPSTGQSAQPQSLGRPPSVPAVSPAVVPSQPVNFAQRSVAPPNAPSDGAQTSAKSPSPSYSSTTNSVPPTPALEKSETGSSVQKVSALDTAAGKKPAEILPTPDEDGPATPALTNGDTVPDIEDTESIYHLPSSLADLLESFEAIKLDALSAQKSIDPRVLAASYGTSPGALDAERPRYYRPTNTYTYPPARYPQEPLPIFDDPKLYQMADMDMLFYTFYFRQGTYQQYLAAKALKAQSWRFHKQYQTWFQRHEEPKHITEDYEQGTYRFFDYESTW